eukprot:3065958-Rhodomonas_salina.1
MMTRRREALAGGDSECCIRLRLGRHRRALRLPRYHRKIEREAHQQCGCACVQAGNFKLKHWHQQKSDLRAKGNT